MILEVALLSDNINVVKVYTGGKTVTCKFTVKFIMIYFNLVLN